MNEAFHPSAGGAGRASEPNRFFVYKTRTGRTLLASKPQSGTRLGKQIPAMPLREKIRQAVTYAEFASDQAI